MSGNNLILVLGSGRSGTSAITRILSLCGCRLPDSLVGATPMNPTGHWESVEATKLNVEFVSRHGFTSDPTMRLDDGEIDESEKEAFIRRIQGFLSTCPTEPALVVKEFRINELFELWREAARRSGISVKSIIAVRHPQEVFDSTRKAFSPTQDDSPSADSYAIFNTFWLKMNLLAERHSRTSPRVVVDYANLMKDWRVELGRISRQLSMDINADESAIDGFLKHDLHRQRCTGPVIETFAYSWTTRVYAILSAAALDRHIDTVSLDEIYHGYRTNSRAFRGATTEKQTASIKFLQDFVQGLPVWKEGRDF